MNKARAQVVFSLLLLLTCGAIVGYAAIPQNTIRQNAGAVFPTLNATAGYFVGPNMIVSAARAASFVTVDTGQGANELYDMDQNVLTSSDVQFNSVDAQEFFLNTVNITDILAYPFSGFSYQIGIMPGSSPSVYYALNGTTGQIDFNGTDAATVIQAAHDALPVANVFGYGEGSGGKIFIKAGIYYISTTINIRTPHVTIEGEGPRTTVLALSNGANTDVIHVIHTAGQEGRRVRISNIMIYGNKANNAAGHGIYTDVDESSDFHLDNVYIISCKQNGVYWRSSNSEADNVYIEVCDGTGWQIDRAKYSTFTACSVWGCTGNGFNIVNAAQAVCSKFIGCHASTCLRGFNILGSTAETPVTLVGCTTALNKRYGFVIGDSRGIILDGCISLNDGQETHNTYSAILISDGGASTHSVGNTIIGCQIISSLETKPKYGIEESSVNQDYNIIMNNKISPMGTATMLLLGVNDKVHFNVGFATESSGSATILNTTTSIVVNHGCNYTPSAPHVSLTLTNNPTNDPGNLYVDTFTATQMTIRCRNDPGASGAIIAWAVKRTP